MSTAAPMRLRFAPSPTGALHIGGARTALYNSLLARGSGGSLLLRVEDTDRERSTPENVRQILEALEWLEIAYDDGPSFQTDSAQRHAQALTQLLETGHAYRSNADAQDVKLYKAQHGQDRGFRGEPESSGAVRLRVPDDGSTVVHDEIRGDTTFAHVHLDDPVIARADGSVLYNFAVAVDDLDAGITHVVRGEDHLSNTPKQLLVFEALGANPPRYAHLPLLHGPDGKKLSKRHGAASVGELRNDGYLPEAVRNYIALLGWGLDEETTFIDDETLTREFSLAKVSRSPAIFDERKLRWMNGRYLRELPVTELTARLERLTGHAGLLAGVEIAQDKISTLNEFWPLASFLYEGAVDDPASWEKTMGDGASQSLSAARHALEATEPFDAEHVEQALRGVAQALEVKPKVVFQSLRVAIAGSTISPGIFESIVVLGREETLARVDAALSRLVPTRG